MSRSTLDELVAACQQGDVQAFEALFQIYHEQVYRIGLRYSGNVQEAEDLTQDVFVKVLREIHRFKGDSNFYTWLCRITINTCLDKSRQIQRNQQRRADPDVFGVNGQDAEHMDMVVDNNTRKQWQTDAQRLLQKALSQISPKLRTVVILKHIEDLSLLEISQILRCSQGTVSSRLNRGRTRLREILGGMGVDQAYLQEA